jgi:hypothetical protein
MGIRWGLFAATCRLSCLECFCSCLSVTVREMGCRSCRMH